MAAWEVAIMGIKDEAERQAEAYTEGNLFKLYGVDKKPPNNTGQAGTGHPNTGHVGPGTGHPNTGHVGPGTGGAPGAGSRDQRLDIFHREYGRFPLSQYEFDTWLANRR